MAVKLGVMFISQGALRKLGFWRLKNDEPRLVGYARISTADQKLQMQIDALVKAGVDPAMIYSEQVSGVSTRRWQLDLAIKACAPGDTLVVWKLDRVGRSMLDLLGRMKKLEDAGIGFKSLTEGIDTTTPGGRLIMHVMGALAQFERDLVVERTRAGVRAHIARGGKHGREKIMTPERYRQAKKMFEAGASARDVAKKFGIQPQTVYNYFPGGPQKYRQKR